MRAWRQLAACGVALAVALLVASGTALGQQASDGSAPWTAPRTADGQPDLQGVWASDSATPLERPAELADQATLTEEEVATRTPATPRSARACSGPR